VDQYLLLVVGENGYARPYFPLEMSAEMWGGCPLVSFTEQVVSASEKWKCSYAVRLYTIQVCTKKCHRRCHKDECLVGLQEGGVKGDQYRIMFFWFVAQCYGLIRAVPEFRRNILPPCSECNPCIRRQYFPVNLWYSTVITPLWTSQILQE
jgi:hypothetical protein